MNELITIQTGGQGSPVVSARELYQFLEIKKQFADWIKSRIEKYGLVEEQDYTTFSLIGEKGRPTIEYALTLDAAKELAMVEGNEKGKAARQYFIEAEKALRQLVAPAPVLTTEQMLLQLAQQQTQLLTNQQEQISQLRADIEEIKTTGHKLPPAPSRRSVGKQLGLPGIPAARPGSLRPLINHRVAEYASRYGEAPQQTYNYLYKRLFDVYGVSVYRLMRGASESLLDAVERYGHLDKLYGLIMAELTIPDEEH